MGKAINLGIFASENIQRATLSLLSDLGIDMEVRSEQQIPIPAIVAASLGKTPKTVQDICDKIAESYLVGIITDKTFTGEYDAASFEEACDNADRYEQMMVFAVDFKRNEKINRTEMATLTRTLNRASKSCPVVLVCRYADEDGTRFALSLCERTAYKQSGHTGEKAGKVNILRGINPEKPHTGHVHILENMRLEKRDKTFGALYDKWFSVFDNDVLTNQFYKELQDWFFWAVKHVHFPNDIDDVTDDKKYNPQNVIRLITRLIFIWFLRQKGLVPKELFNREDLTHLVKDFEPDNFESSTYYRVILQNLFFATLNKKIEERAFISDNFIENRNLGKHKIKTFMRHARDLAVSKEDFIKLVRPVPFMNNSLFECLDNKVQNGHTYNWDGFSDSNKPQRQAFVPNYLFFAKEEYVDLSEEYDNPNKSSVKVSGLLTILKRYNFTVEENTPLDQDVALDPELLGKVFENLLAAYNPETEKTVRKSTGSYYTPRPIVQYMVNESLIAYLKKTVSDVEEETLRSLLSYSDDDKVSTLNEQQTHDIVSAILNCKVLDPACGSGAFPMGMLQQMSHLLSRVDATNKYWEEVVINRALTDEAFVASMKDEEKEAHRHEIEEVFKLSVNYPDYARKLYLIENCIYGVDIQSIAVQISRLRFFISLLCEQQPSKDASKNYDIKPLPNLEMKFVCANTLVRLEHIDEARELFANKDILDLIAKLKGVRHELFVVTDQHVKERLLSKDETLRGQIMLSTGDCYVKGTEDKIKEYEHTITDLEKKLSIAEREPDDIVQQSVQQDLFGEKEEIITVNRKEVKIKEITGNIRHFKRECKRLRDTLSSGRDKAMYLAKQLTDWNPYDQNVSSPFFDPEWMFGINKGFSIVIGNPPFVVVKKTDYPSYQWNSDLYKMFFEKGLKELINDSGLLSFISPKFYLVNKDDEEMRKFFMNEMKLVSLTLCNPFDVVTENVITFIEKGATGLIVPVYKHYPSEKAFRRIDNLNIEYSRTNPYSEMVLEIPSEVIELLAKIQSSHPVFKDITKSKRGAEVSKNYLRGNDDGLLSLIGMDVNKYSISCHDTYLDYGHKEYKRLKSFFNQDLIYLRRVDSCLEATTSDFHYGFNKNVYGIQVTDTYYKLYYVLAILNAKVVDFYYKKKFSTKKEDVFPEIQTYLYEQLPIPHATQEQQKQIVDIVASILQKRSERIDTSDDETFVDMLVYHLYGLSFEDVLLIDPKTKIKREEYEKLCNDKGINSL